MGIQVLGRTCLPLLAGTVLTSISAPPTMAQSDDRPNFVVVLVDDMRWDDFGAGGHPFVRTPNIDRVAAEGAMFLNAFTTTPLCSPARASFLTGLYAQNPARPGPAVLRKLLLFI